MPEDIIRYDLLVQEALRGVVRRVLIDAATHGLPGEHHFFISFRTKSPGVHISNRLLERHPEEMTIALQHQFWDLIVSDSGLEVGLSFGGIPEKLVVPFDAMSGFWDPSVDFGLKFELSGVESADNDTPADALTAQQPLERASEVSGAQGKDAEGGAEIVSLNSFRKKP
jgi:hypothetical protein